MGKLDSKFGSLINFHYIVRYESFLISSSTLESTMKKCEKHDIICRTFKHPITPKSGAITNFQESVGWTITKFRLNNSLANQWHDLEICISKKRLVKTHVFKFFGFLL